MPIINVIISGIMLTSIILLILDAMSSQDHREKSHLKILAILAVVTSWFLIIFEIINNHQILIKNHINYMTIISSLFLITNTFIAIFIEKKEKIKYKKLYFLILSLLVLSLVNISSTSLIIKMISNTGWLIVITTISINNIDNSIKAEIGLKMLYHIIINLILFIIGILFIAYPATSFDLKDILNKIDMMPEDAFDKIIEKYVEMNIAHPFMEGNGRSTRIWLDLILKKNLKVCVDWSKISKKEYLSAMEKSVTDSAQIKTLLQSALTDRINDRDTFMRGIDYSYYYEQPDDS